ARSEPQPFPSLRLFGYAAFNPALEDIVAEAEARGVTLCGLYGMSECHALYAMQPPQLDSAERRKGGGRPLSPRAAVRVRDPESGVLLGPGQPGEIEVSGPSLMLEYYDNPEATAEALGADGYLRTGDLGYLEDDGRFCYLARMGDVLRLGGFLVSPLEIEAVIDAHDDVAASQVVALSIDGRLRPVAFVLPAAGAVPAAEAIVAWCRERLAGYKVPARVFTLEAFPTTASANGTKIQKARLRAMAESLCAAAAD
ncbi:MAG: AMP-binding protein, partial [Gammaproteobacteria bacterium]|nr:AMP-binding protein [Gammaproteobacteria bacterium]